MKGFTMNKYSGFYAVLLFGSLGARDVQEPRLLPALDNEKPIRAVDLAKPIVPGRKVINKIVAKVNGATLLLSDLEQPRINTENGRPFSLQEAIIEELTVQHAGEQHMLPSQLDIEQQITRFKIQNGLQDMTDKQFDAEIKAGGLTLKMYKQQIGRRIAVENVKRSEILEKVVIDSKEVEAYYKEHPEYSKEAYSLQVCSIDPSILTSKNWADRAAWEDLGWINTKDLSERHKCVCAMKKGDVSAPMPDPENKDKVQVVKLLAKRERRLKTLDDRYMSIDRLLQQKKVRELTALSEKGLASRAIITYL